MRKLLLLMMVVSCISGRAQQNPFMADAFGRPLHWGTTYIADGTPYFQDQYAWAEIVAQNGRVYQNVLVKFNLLERQLQYMTEDGKEMIATTPIRTVKFPLIGGEKGVMTNVVLTSFSGVVNAEGAPVYQVLDSGKVSVLKSISITYRDEKKYGEASVTRHFDRKETDFVLKDGNFIKAEKNRDFLTSLLADKQAQVSSFIESNGLKCKSLADIRKVVQYYNSL